MPFLVARDRGFFREEGLEPEIVLMRSSLTMQALLAGGIDFGTATGAAVSAAAVDEKLQREMIAVAAQRIKPQPPVTSERVFDFTIARKVVEALR